MQPRKRTTQGGYHQGNKAFANPVCLETGSCFVPRVLEYTRFVVTVVLALETYWNHSERSNSTHTITSAPVLITCLPRTGPQTFWKSCQITKRVDVPTGTVRDQVICPDADSGDAALFARSCGTYRWWMASHVDITHEYSQSIPTTSHCRLQPEIRLC